MGSEVTFKQGEIRQVKHLTADQCMSAFVIDPENRSFFTFAL
jgi:hypothetical protein